jgi:uncharacterized protein YdaL
LKELSLDTTDAVRGRPLTCLGSRLGVAASRSEYLAECVVRLRKLATWTHERCIRFINSSTSPAVFSDDAYAKAQPKREEKSIAQATGACVTVFGPGKIKMVRLYRFRPSRQTWQ